MDARGLSPSDHEPLYPMAVAERLTGLSRRQIRYYEQHGLLRPHRTGGGQRLFSPSEIRTLLRIKQLMAKGYATMEALGNAWRVVSQRSEAPGGDVRLPPRLHPAARPPGPPVSAATIVLGSRTGKE